ncbi:hypothetical protein BDD12DRAFT_809574 [Trichophaea hybrida]|nr:hypothetical protein BDD12DRAFT_809574 [Trichophaea hybrida]
MPSFRSVLNTTVGQEVQVDLASPATDSGSARADLAFVQNMLSIAAAMRNLTAALQALPHSIPLTFSISGINDMDSINPCEKTISALTSAVIELALLVVEEYKAVINILGGRSWLWNHARDLWCITKDLADATDDMIHAAKKPAEIVRKGIEEKDEDGVLL